MPKLIYIDKDTDNELTTQSDGIIPKLDDVIVINKKDYQVLRIDHLMSPTEYTTTVRVIALKDQSIYSS